MLEFILTSNQVLTALAYWAIAWAITNIPIITDSRDEAVQWLIFQLWKQPYLLKAVHLFYELISCHKCLTFWLVLVTTQHPILALFCAAATAKMDK
jgi:hypothetical protein